MRNATKLVVLLVGVGLTAAPVFAAELRVTGFIDNVFPAFESNLSTFDNDATRNSDQATYGRQRFRAFFNFIASDDLRGVFAIEIDNMYGAPAHDLVGSGCIEGEGPFAFASCGFDRATDNNQIEVKELYADFRIPQIPIGNRWRLGGFRFQALPLHSSLFYNVDGGGGDLRLTFTDQVSLLVSYQQLEEDIQRFPGSPKVGEDYITGMTLMLRPMSGLDFHLVGYYGHVHQPFSSTGTGSPFVAIANDSRNVATESRYYVGFDSRYRLGNFRIEPTFIYLLGKREFTSASAALTGVSDIDFDGFMTHIEAGYTTGPWLFAGKFAYKSGNKADEDINNRGIGNRADIGWRHWSTEANRFGQWFEIHGVSDVNGPGMQVFRRGGETGNFDRFGWMVVGGKAEYKATDNLILEGAVGGFWTTEKTGCPANQRVGSLTGPCGGPTNSSGEPALNFTGDSRFIGWEIAAGIRYTIMPGLTWTPRMAYAEYGDAFSANNRKAMDAWAFANRLIYIF